MKKFVAVATIFLTASLVGCAGMSNQDAGTLTGAVAGGLLGSQFGKGGGNLLAIGAGTLAGAYFGGQVGRSMDEVDRMRMNEAFENNRLGQPAYWVNERTHASYTVVPMDNVTIDGNPYCREYSSTAIINGRKQKIYGTACRQPDGSWQIVS